MKVVQCSYTVKEFSLNPSRAIRKALQGVEVTISLRGVPAVRLVPVAGPQGATAAVLERLATLPGFQVAQLSPGLEGPTLGLVGPGPTAAELLLEDRR
jgi:antitoxin (DNA-binding transcriptional repressor) of toxin-antitoxin stability system